MKVIVPTAARRAKTGRQLAALWPAIPHLSRKDAESFGRDIEASRRKLKIKPCKVAAD
jgi:hypothetical protein